VLVASTYSRIVKFPLLPCQSANMSGLRARDLVAGSDMRTPSDGAGSCNVVGTLVNSLLGGASKTQEQLCDVSA